MVPAKTILFCKNKELQVNVKGRRSKELEPILPLPQLDRIWPSRSLIWEAADPYLYLRTTRDGRVIVGGEDEPFSDDALRDKIIPKKIAAIARKAKRIFPKLDFKPAYAWTGSFGESPTGLPAIGPIPKLPRCYAVLGFGGNGFTCSMLAAQLPTRIYSNYRAGD